MPVTDQILQEFPPVSPEKWKEFFLKEVKQEQIQEHHSYLGFDLLPFYTARHRHADQARLLQQLSSGRAEAWYINRVIGLAGDAVAVNKKILHDLGKGISSLTLQGDLRNEKETDALLKDVQAAYIEINFLSSDPVHTAKQYLAWCERNGISHEKIFGSFFTDPLTHALKNGGWKNGREQDMEQVPGLVELLRHAPHLHALTVDAAVYHYAGASLVQTIAYTLAHAAEYLNIFKASGIDPVSVADRITFKWPVGTSFFAEIAALRAFRLLWNNLCAHLSGNKKQLYPACIHAETSVHYWSVADMYNNLLRATTQSMAAIAGGASTLLVHPYNVVSTDANAFSERMAANIQLLLREESFFGKVVDPAAGAYVVEELTHQLAEKALLLLKRTEAGGGLLQQAQQGILQQELAHNMALMTEALKKGEIKILGANLYPDKNEQPANIPRKELFDNRPAGKEFVPLKLQRLASILED